MATKILLTMMVVSMTFSRFSAMEIVEKKDPASSSSVQNGTSFWGAQCVLGDHLRNFRTDFRNQ